MLSLNSLVWLCIACQFIFISRAYENMYIFVQVYIIVASRHFQKQHIFFNFIKHLQHQNVPAIVPPEYSDGTHTAQRTDIQNHFVLGDRFHSSSDPHESPLCQYHNIDLCTQAPTIKTSIQESQNNRKNMRRLRSSCMQSFEVHIAYNFLMDFYQNEEIICRQKKTIEKTLQKGEKVIRDNNLRFIICRDDE